ncbi:MAG: hypothetical protein A2Y10_01495 [Planctomycetes bacterium GWF2_41_51]|nr:MAG: hypothetical protein A2Y10_01495 [Planctomycetes bacterium GWF2_41_51]
MENQHEIKSERKWHSFTAEDILKRLDSKPSGLTDTQAGQRLSEFGQNILAPKKKESLFFIFIHQFASPLVYILIAAAIVKFILKGLLDGAVIVGVLLFMAAIGFVQESKARKAMDALQRMVSLKSKVKRDNKLIEIEPKNLVPGDIISVESGDRVPADARLIEAQNLKTNEAAFTGESMPAEKNTGRVAHDASITDRTNMIYMGTNVTSGRAAAVVVSTGMSTEIGKIAGAMRDIESEKTPLQKSIHSLSHYLIIIVLVACVLLALAGLWRQIPIVDIFMLAVSVAVAAIPEGLPAVVTVVLAIGMQIMAKNNAIIRKLIAVETLGSTTVICSDKTGTLTLNQMTVGRLFCNDKIIEVTGSGYEPKGEFLENNNSLPLPLEDSFQKLLTAAALCNDASLTMKDETYNIIGDPTEGALVTLAAKAGIDRHQTEEKFPRIDEITFESEKQYMATMHRGDNKNVLWLKGSAERTLAMCSNIFKNGKISELSEQQKDKILKTNEDFAKNAMRVIAAAFTEYPPDTQKIDEETLPGTLTFLGMFGMIDPPRDEAIKAVADCQNAGIKVVMVTGDNKITAKAIADQLGLSNGKAISGSELSQLSTEDLHSQIEDISVFARIEPLHKLRIIEAFKNRGEIVAMTGDGVNDAPALESANIGISMGITGTDVAKEACDMVLADDNFATIVVAVEEGRAIFNRLRNVILFMLSTCFGELLVVLSCVFFLGDSPLLPLQILWINLVTGAMMSIPLGLEPKTGEELKQPPRDPKVGLLYSGMMTRVAFFAGLYAILSTIIFALLFEKIPFEQASTIIFCSVVIFEWILAFNSRSDEVTIFKIGVFKNRWMIAALLIALLLQLSVIYVPAFQSPFSTVPLTLNQWLIALIPGIIIFIAETCRKIFFPKLFSKGKYNK